LARNRSTLETPLAATLPTPAGLEAALERTAARFAPAGRDIILCENRFNRMGDWRTAVSLLRDAHVEVPGVRHGVYAWGTST
jgi:hypothetical protein